MYYEEYVIHRYKNKIQYNLNRELEPNYYFVIF